MGRISSGREYLRLKRHGEESSDSVSAVAFAPDGRTLISASLDGTVCLWEIASGKKRLRTQVGYGSNNGICFTPDGANLVMGSMSDNDVRFHGVATGELVHRLPGHDGEVTNLAFTPDGTRLASSSWDLTALVWDVRELLRDIRPKEALLPPKELDASWEQLASADAEKAHRAIWSLVATPRQAVPFLGEALRAQDLPDVQHLPQLIRDLDSDQFTVREKATRELDRLAWLVRPGLCQALARPLPLESQRWIEWQLRRTESRAPPPEALRVFRALEVLEAIGTPEARRVLRKLAEGAPGAMLTEDARAALKRLERR